MWSSFTATIANGASLSDAIHVPPGYQLVGIQIPSSWTAADLTFQGCRQSNETYVNLYDPTGAELSVVAAASRLIVIDADQDGLDFPFLKIRSGTSGAAVNQGAERSIIVHFGKR